MRFQPLVEMADSVMKYKYIVKNVARRHGKTATFMPKPIFGDNGIRHARPQSLWKDGDNLFAGVGYAGLSDMACYAIGGLLEHAPALLRLHQPDHQQLQAAGPRLRGAGQPRLLAGATARPRSASRSTRRARRPSGSSSAARTARAIRTRLRRHADGDASTASRTRSIPASRRTTTCPRTPTASPRCPGSLAEALDALERDHEFLLQGGVFSEDVIRTWIWYKREKEVDPSACDPIPPSSRSISTPSNPRARRGRQSRLPRRSPYLARLASLHGRVRRLGHRSGTGPAEPFTTEDTAPRLAPLAFASIQPWLSHRPSPHATRISTRSA